MFCGKCGAPQEPMEQLSVSSQEADVNKGNSKQMNNISSEAPISRFDAFMAGVKKGGIHYVILGGAVLIILSVFLPFVNILGMAEFSIKETMDVTAHWVVCFAMVAAYVAMFGNYKYPVVIGHGYLFAFLVCVFQYHQKLKEMESFGRVLTRSAFNMGSGMYALIFGIVGLIIGGLIASLERDGEQPNADSLLAQWKEEMLQPMKLYSLHLPGIAWSVIYALILLLIASEIDEF